MIFEAQVERNKKIWDKKGHKSACVCMPTVLTFLCEFERSYSSLILQLESDLQYES